MAAIHGDSQHRQMVSEAAYFLAEHRGFNGGDPVADWLQAEAQVEAMTGADQGVIDRIEQQLAGMNRKLKSMRRRVSGLKADARQEWERDIRKLTKLHDGLQEKFADVRRQGADVSGKARAQLEAAWDEAADRLRRLEHRLEKARK